MRWSKAFIPTLKENPSEAEIASHRLMFRAGLLRKLASGVHDYLPLMTRVLNKLKGIIRREMDNVGAHEVFLPVLAPADLWKESGRYDDYGPELMRIQDRHDREFVLGPTHEEVITDLVRRDVTSYRQLPLTLYQIQTKFRDEIRPRFGILRAKEFLMKDAYSFHRSEEDLDQTYKEMFKAYSKILDFIGVRWAAVMSEGGEIGGDFTQEFMVLAESGEEPVLYCKECGFAAKQANVESQQAPEIPKGVRAGDPEKVFTPEKKTVAEVTDFLNVTSAQLIKTLLYTNKGFGTVAVLIRGDREVNEEKVKKVLNWKEIEFASPSRVQEISGGPAGFVGPLGLKDIPILADNELFDEHEMVCGANEKDIHFKNVWLLRDMEDSKSAIWDSFRLLQNGDPCKKCQKPLELTRGIEVAQVFKLGTKYSDALQCVYADETGTKKPMIMGCYGFGVTRMIGALIEQSHDEKGIIWPLGLTPYDVIITLISLKDEECVKTAESIYSSLLESGVDVLFDDRDLGPGFKFKDAELIGIPLRVTVGSRGLKEGLIEITERATGDVEKVPPDQVVEKIKKRIQDS